MALIKCLECNNEVSDQSKFCIHCGYPIKQKVIENPILSVANSKYICWINDELVDLSFYVHDIKCNNKDIIITISNRCNITKTKATELYNLIYEDLPIPKNITCERKREGSTSENLKVDSLMKVLCFFIPIVGIIIYCLNVSTSPKQAKKCLKYMLYGFLFEIIFVILLMILSLF